MNTWKVILATMVIFGTGVVTGGALVRKAVRWHAPRQQETPAALRQVAANLPGAMRVDFLKRLERELDLSPEQRLKVDRILSQSQERTRKLMEPIAPQLREEVQHARAEFRAVLTPSQQEVFDQLLKQRNPREPRDKRKTEKTKDTKAP